MLDKLEQHQGHGKEPTQNSFNKMESNRKNKTDD
jgi:hypothetical protein